MSFIVPKIRKIKGVFTPSGDKSICHRALILSSLAEGKSHIKNFVKSEDTLATSRALKMMGVEIVENVENKITELTIIGKGLEGLKKPSHVLDVGNSGTTLRLLTGLLSSQKFSSVITGDDSLVRRPMKELIQLLRKMGANLQALEDDNFAPVQMYPALKALTAIGCEPANHSAQIKSAILLAGLYAEGKTEIKESIPTRDHTERMLKFYGAQIEQKEGRIELLKSDLQGKNLTIPGDLSSASFLISAALLLKDSELTIDRVGLNPTRMGFLKIISQMGAKISYEVLSSEVDPQGTISVQFSELSSITVSKNMTVDAIDELPLVALLATQAKGQTQILDAKALRYKESDRLRALALELSKMGANIQELEDGLVIEGPTILKGAKVKSHNDHRIAMTLYVAGLIAEGETEIDSMECCQKSFPNFLESIKNISHS